MYKFIIKEDTAKTAVKTPRKSIPFGGDKTITDPRESEEQQGDPSTFSGLLDFVFSRDVEDVNLYNAVALVKDLLVQSLKTDKKPEAGDIVYKSPTFYVIKGQAEDGGNIAQSLSFGNLVDASKTTALDVGEINLDQSYLDIKKDIFDVAVSRIAKLIPEVRGKIKFLGKGQYGVAFLLSTGRVFKIFSETGMRGGSEIAKYNKLQDRQFSGEATKHEIAIYTAKLLNKYVGVVEMAKVDMDTPVSSQRLPGTEGLPEEHKITKKWLVEFLFDVLHEEIYGKNLLDKILKSDVKSAIKLAQNILKRNERTVRFRKEGLVNSQMIKQIAKIFVNEIRISGGKGMDSHAGNFGYLPQDPNTIVTFDTLEENKKKAYKFIIKESDMKRLERLAARGDEEAQRVLEREKVRRHQDPISKYFQNYNVGSLIRSIDWPENVEIKIGYNHGKIIRTINDDDDSSYSFKVIATFDFTDMEDLRVKVVSEERYGEQIERTVLDGGRARIKRDQQGNIADPEAREKMEFLLNKLKYNIKGVPPKDAEGQMHLQENNKKAYKFIIKEGADNLERLHHLWRSGGLQDDPEAREMYYRQLRRAGYLQKRKGLGQFGVKVSIFPRPPFEYVHFSELKRYTIRRNETLLDKYDEQAGAIEEKLSNAWGKMVASIVGANNVDSYGGNLLITTAKYVYLDIKVWCKFKLTDLPDLTVLNEDTYKAIENKTQDVFNQVEYKVK